MRSFVLYGLDDDGRVTFTETFTAFTAEKARQYGVQHLEKFDRVEVWESTVCVYRSRRKFAGNKKP